MTDNAITEATGITDTARAWLSGVTLAFSFAAISYVTLFGKSENSLHGSTLSWAWTAIILILGGIGFGAIIPTVMSATKK